MDDNIKKTIIDNLNIKTTNELMDIWVNGTEEEWQPFVFDAVKEILLKRKIAVTEEEITDELPNRENKLLADEHLARASKFMDQNNPDQVIAECDSVIKLLPDNDLAYYWRGLAYDEIHQRIKAMADFQKAGQLNPDADEYWDKVKDLQKRLDRDFESSPSKKYLDQASIYIEDEQPEHALEQAELALQEIPEIAGAYTYLGFIFHQLGKLEKAIGYYEHAISLNTRYYDARSHLAEAKSKFDEEQSRIPVEELPEDYYKELEETIVAEEKEEIGPDDQDDVAPGWVYKENPLYEVKGPIDLGLRSYPIMPKPPVSESDPFQKIGTVVRSLFSGSFRSHNPAYLISVFLLGCVFCLPLALKALPMLTGESPAGEVEGLFFIFALPGLILFWDVLMSLFTPDDGSSDDDGRKFY